ncbi:hypothetical protein BDQ12DRAFT_731546 [Crucibulum laeve]|uniref:Uncharacterized protein n=1 Tax=Crucibulum laeve TaxID=68775 RepID=A0A5C3MF48_9AGAR|nr:hypothetical protein BDQ12DRAFT_731546 [Crucibulum laeve]
MSATVTFAFAIGLLCLSIASVAAIPTWEGLNGRGSMGSLVPGASYIEALGPVRDNEVQTKHLTVHVPGSLGNLTVAPNSREPPLFYIYQNQLWQFTNETTIYPVNVVNVTGTSDFPLQLVLGTKREGVSTGSWRWRGAMLYYDQGTKGNQGLFYSCITESELPGVFMFLKPSPTPPGCEPLTLHSFGREYLNKRR